MKTLTEEDSKIISKDDLIKSINNVEDYTKVIEKSVSSDVTSKSGVKNITKEKINTDVSKITSLVKSIKNIITKKEKTEKQFIVQSEVKNELNQIDGLSKSIDKEVKNIDTKNSVLKSDTGKSVPSINKTKQSAVTKVINRWKVFLKTVFK